MIGQRFGRWVVIDTSDQKVYRRPACLCRCDCGTARLVATYRLGVQTFSCGCARNEAAALKNTRHGLSKHRLQGTWRSMKERCYNSNHDAFHRYGGRGITVCKRWHKLENFIADNERLALPGTTLDRINNGKSYSPGNCHWVTHEDQANNRDNNVILEFGGRYQTCAQWARELKMFEPTLRKRLETGWTVEKALTTQVRRRKGSPHQPQMMK